MTDEEIGRIIDDVHEMLKSIMEGICGAWFEEKENGGGRENDPTDSRH